MTEANRQLADQSSAMDPLCQAAHGVQQASDFDANLQSARLQRDSQRLQAQFEQAKVAASGSFGLGGVHQLQTFLSLSLLTRASLILDAALAAKLALFLKGQNLKVGGSRADSIRP